jgi:hypothetical protein
MRSDFGSQLVSVDARSFSLLARFGKAGELAQAAALWRDGFLPGLVLNIEEFDTWRMQEADRLSGAAADVYAPLGRRPRRASKNRAPSHKSGVTNLGVMGKPESRRNSGRSSSDRDRLPTRAVLRKHATAMFSRGE